MGIFEPYLLSTKNLGGPQEGGHGVVHHVQADHYQRVWVIVGGPVGNPESFRVHRKSPKSKSRIPWLVFVECKSGCPLFRFAFEEQLIDLICLSFIKKNCQALAPNPLGPTLTQSNPIQNPN